MAKDTQPVQVPKAVLDGIENVRQIGAYNLFDVLAVVAMARQLDLRETAQWIEENRRDYATGILFGFEADPYTEIIEYGLRDGPADFESMWDTPGSRQRARLLAEEDEDGC